MVNVPIPSLYISLFYDYGMFFKEYPVYLHEGYVASEYDPQSQIYFPTPYVIGES